MKVLLDRDEIYPVYYRSDSWGIEVDVPQSILNEWEDVYFKWCKLQGYFENLYEEAEKRKLLENCKTNGIPAK